MRIGKETGKIYYPYFKHLADSLNKIYPIDYDPLARLPKSEKITIDEIAFQGIQKTSRTFLLQKLDIHTGNKYSVAEINKGFEKAYSTRYYDNVYYELQPLSPGHAKLLCKVKESPLTQLKLGLSFHTYSGAAILANLTVRNLLLDKSRTMMKVAAGEYFRFLAEHSQAFGARANNYFNISYRTENLPLNLYEDGKKASLYHAGYHRFDLNFTRVFGINWSLAEGINYQKNTFSPEIADNFKADGNSKNLYAYLRSESITTDRANFPTRGYEFSAEAGVVFNRKAQINVYDEDGNAADSSGIVNGQPEFYRFMLNYTKYHPLNAKLVLLCNLQAGITLHSQGFIFDDYYVGGIQQFSNNHMVFSGLSEGEITTTSLSSAMLGMQFNFSGSLFLTGRINTAIYDFSTLTKVYDKEQVKWINGFSLGLGYNLGMLPMELNAMYSPEIKTFYANVKIGFLF